MSIYSGYVFQFPFYAIVIGSDWAKRLDGVSAFGDEKSAKEFVRVENEEIVANEYGNSKDAWRNDDHAIAWQVFDHESIRDLGEDSTLFESVVALDMFEGRYCTISLKAFIELNFATQKSFAFAQGVAPAQVTQWLNNDCFVTCTEDGWVLTSSRREIKLNDESRD